MENATDALIMAGQVLIFIVALSICMSSFSTLRSQIDEILGRTDTIKFAKDSEGYNNFIESENKNSNRVVGAETVVASMYRAIKENYVIYVILNRSFTPTELSGLNAVLYTISDTSIKPSNMNADASVFKFTIGIHENEINQNVDEILSKGFYEKYLKDKLFNEYQGEYQNASAPGVTSENKSTNRIITYVEV